MHIRRVLGLAVMLAAFFGTQALIAQNREQHEQRETRELVQLVDAVVAGQEAPADIGVQWEGNHFMKAAEGGTYIPFTVSVDASQFGAPAAGLYVRAISKDPAADPSDLPWDDVMFLDVPPDGNIQRALVLEPGEYEVLVAIKEEGLAIGTARRAAPPAKAGLVRQDITVPGFTDTGLVISSVLIGTISPLAAPLDEDEQKENPYTFGQMSVSLSDDVSKSGELMGLFWIYGADEDDGKPNVQIDYSFHRQTPGGEEFFNKTPPQLLNRGTLPPQFDIATDQLPGMLFVPVASFPEGEYRLEITVTDSMSGETIIHNATFNVEA